VKEHVVTPDKALEHVSRDEEHVRREGVPLSEPAQTPNPFSRDAIEEDGRA
jgi:hypothetical protein